MTGRAITFDFHNTLVRCDAWFALEVRRLPSAVLRWSATEGLGPELSPLALAAADAEYRRLREAIMEHGREESAEASVAIVLQELAIPVDEAAIARGVEAVMRGTLAEAAPLPGAVATVRALARAGVRLGVVSSAVYHPFLEWALQRFAIRDAFADVTTSASAGYYKSRPEIFLHALARLDADPAHAVHVGDSYRYDVLGARRAGLRAVWVRGAAQPPNGEAPPDLIVPSLVDAAPEILRLLDGA